MSTCSSPNYAFSENYSIHIPEKFKVEGKSSLFRELLYIYLSSRKYANPRLAGGWFSLLFLILDITRTIIVTMYGSILYSSLTERFIPVGMKR